MEQSFEIATTPVTNFQFRMYQKAIDHESALDGRTSNEPVTRVNYVQARLYANWLSALDPHYNFRLPTEAE